MWSGVCPGPRRLLDPREIGAPREPRGLQWQRRPPHGQSQRDLAQVDRAGGRRFPKKGWPDRMENQTPRTPDVEIEDFATLFAQSEAQAGPIEEGKVVSGTVIQLSKDYAVVDIGYKSEGQVPISEFVSAPGSEPAVKVGDKVEVLVESRENDTGMVVLSKEKADKMRIWDEISAACERDEIVKGVIVGRVKGGLSVDIGVKAFLPGSQVDIRPVRNLDQYISKEFEFKVIKFNKKRGNIVLSRRVLLEKQREELKKETLKNLREGAVLKGVVKNLTDYGAFIDLEQGVEGLVHVSEMSWTKRVKHPSKLVNVGDQVEAVVLDIDPKAKRISLGMKQIEANPWTLLEDKYPIGTTIRGEVRNVTDFGIFVGVEEGIDGLVHVSDISWTERIKHPGEKFKKGDVVEAVVLNIDVENERFSLGIKQAHADPWTTLSERHPVGSRVKGKVTKVTDFGAFVEIEPGMEGLVHVSEMKGEPVENPREVVTEGQEVEVKVIDMDLQDRKVALSIKALSRDGGEDDYREYLRRQGDGRARLGDLMEKF